MNKKTSVSMTERYEASTTAENANKIQLTEEKYLFNVLGHAIQKGIDSGIADDFDAAQHLAILKSQRKIDS